MKSVQNETFYAQSGELQGMRSIVVPYPWRHDCRLYLRVACLLLAQAFLCSSIAAQNRDFDVRLLCALFEFGGPDFGKEIFVRSNK